MNAAARLGHPLTTLVHHLGLREKDCIPPDENHGGDIGFLENPTKSAQS